MKEWFFRIFAVALIFAIAEGVSFLIFKNFEEKYLNYSSAIQFDNEVPIFESISVDGIDYYYSRFFPTRYYSNLEDDRGRRIIKKKTKNIFRVFVYGESSVAGSPFGHWGSFALNLEEQLNLIKKDPNTIVEIMNFGLSGIGSTRIAHFIDKTLSYEPDLVIFYVGHNELNDNAERIVSEKQISSRKPSPMISLFTKHSYFFKTAVLAALRLDAYNKKINFSKDGSVVDEKFFEAFDDMSLNRRLDMYREIYRTNLDHVVASVKKHGAKLLLMSQISNDLVSPAMTHWMPNTHELSPIRVKSRSLTSLETSEERLRETFENGHPVKEKLEEVILQNKQSAFAAYVQGIEALKIGENTKAVQFLLQAKEWDPYPVRFRATYKQILQALHNPENGVYFIDTEEFVRSKLPDGILDGRIIIDVMHPNLTGYKWIASSILQLYFLQYKDKADIFNFELYDPNDIWKLNVDPEKYWLVCQRYFPKFISGNWNNCASLARTAYANAANTDQKRYHLRLWEFLYFYALSTGDKAALTESLKLFPNQPNLVPKDVEN